MFTIGDFARHGRVSVRMLRHYDAVGLLHPARVDEYTGYRYYTASQLATLNRIVALKDLGFTLQQVADILHDAIDVTELHGMLRLRRAELREQIAADTARLAQVEARLSAIDTEGRMPSIDIQIKRIPAIRVAELTAVAEDFRPEAIGPVIGPLYAELGARLASAGISPTGPAISYYDGADDGAVLVHAAIPVDAKPGAGNFAVVDLPEVEQAATVVHHGSMDDVMPTVQTLARWIDANGYRSTGYQREVTLEANEHCQPAVTELQEPVTH